MLPPLPLINCEPPPKKNLSPSMFTLEPLRNTLSALSTNELVASPSPPSTFCPNEIKLLCEVIKPDYSLITNISESHISNYKSMNELVKTKTAIVVCEVSWLVGQTTFLISILELWIKEKSCLP